VFLPKHIPDMRHSCDKKLASTPLVSELFSSCL
jgi:hypothetical protein